MAVWVTARGAGLTALVLLTVSTAHGVLGARRANTASQVVVQYIHRTAGALGIGVLIVHVATIIADSYAKVGVAGAVIPITAGFRASWVGLGTITMYFLVAVAGVGLPHGRMAASSTGARIWRVTHVLAYLVWALAILHGYTSGTDSSVPWVIALYVLCLVAVLPAGHGRLASLAGRENPTRDLPRAVAVTSIRKAAV